MKIDKLELENFKNYDRLVVEFRPGINLIVGLNGSGKTALLEALTVAIGGFFSTRPQREQRVIDYSEIRIDENGKRVSSTTVKASNEDRTWSRTISSATKRNDNLHVNTIKRFGSEFFNAFENIENKSIAPTFVYFSTQRLFKDATKGLYQGYDPAEGRKNGYLLCLEEKSIKSTINDWLGKAVTNRATFQIKEIDKPDLCLENVETAIREAMIQIMGIARDFSLKIYLDAFIDGELFIRYENNGTVRDLPLGYYSDGFRNVIYLIADVVWRASQLNPWLAFDELRNQSVGVVLIDEIDLHLHQSWQSKVLPFLQYLFPKVQFVVTTHSPAVVANFDLREENGIEIDCVLVIDNNQISPVESYFGRDINSVTEGLFEVPSRNDFIASQMNKFLKLVRHDRNIDHLDVLDRIKRKMLPFFHSTSSEMIYVSGILNKLHTNKLLRQSNNA